METWFVLYIDSDGTSRTTKVQGGTIIAAIQNFYRDYPGLTADCVRSCFSTRP